MVPRTRVSRSALRAAAPSRRVPQVIQPQLLRQRIGSAVRVQLGDGLVRSRDGRLEADRDELRGAHRATTRRVNTRSPGTRPSMPPSHCRRAAGSWSWAGSSSGAGRLRTAPLGRWSRSWPRSWGRACVGQRRQRPGRRGARSRRVPRRPGRLNERHPASWRLWLKDLALDSLETGAGDCRGDGLALLCFPMSVRKEVYEEPRGHRQPGWPGVVRSGGGRDG